ncbi:hypothetical protein TNCV_4042611 [Trichonephila clavipes]|nr:hypothetical protein TNCV_4042611 [Trichonephila clavipes]
MVERSRSTREKFKIEKKIRKGCEESLAPEWSSSSPPIGGLSYSERGWRTDGEGLVLSGNKIQSRKKIKWVLKKNIPRPVKQSIGFINFSLTSTVCDTVYMTPTDPYFIALFPHRSSL